MSMFGKRLKSARQVAGLSQEQVGVQAGIEEESASTRMNRYEKGVREPAVEIVGRIAKVLDVPISYFYSEDDDEANLVLAFHRMSAKEREELLKHVDANSDMPPQL